MSQNYAIFFCYLKINMLISASEPLLWLLILGLLNAYLNLFISQLHSPILLNCLSFKLKSICSHFGIVEFLFASRAYYISISK